MFEDRRCSLQCQGTLHLGAKTIIVVIRVPEIRSRDRSLQFVANTGPAKIYFQWATHDMFISKYSAEEYYKAVDGPKEEHWYFINHEFNDAQSCHDRREWRTKELGLHAKSPPIHPTPIRPCSRLDLPFGRRRSWRWVDGIVVGWSATLPLPDHGRVACDSIRIIETPRYVP